MAYFNILGGTMKILKLTALSLIFAVTACSSGGGGSGGNSESNQSIDNIATTQPVSSTTSTENTSEEQETPTKTVTERPVHGYYLVGAERNNVGITAFSLRSNSLNIIDHFDSIPLSDPAQSPTDGYYKIGNGIANDDSILKETKFGVVENSRQVYIFAQGNRATDMPVSGNASYTGEAILVTVNEDDEFKRLGYFNVPAKFNADFEQKTLLASLQLTELGAEGNLVFDAEIKGDKFSKWGGSDGIQVDGAFYGNNASELGGVLLKRDAFSGSFGAKKDD